MKLENDNRSKTGKFTNLWKLNNILLNNQWIKEITRKVRQYLETNENKKTIFQNLWNAVKRVLREKFIAINAYVKNNFQLNLKLAEGKK